LELLGTHTGDFPWDDLLHVPRSAMLNSNNSKMVFALVSILKQLLHLGGAYILPMAPPWYDTSSAVVDAERPSETLLN
jgi:hypothetical protein